MSTKINSRSPYFISFTKPTQTLGTFACTGNKFMANPSGFEVSAYGVIKEPDLQNGTIVGRSATSFAENTTASAISRTVTYTIEIPLGYDNSGTISCDVTASQPVKAVATGGSNCPTVSSAISDITGLNGTQTIDLSTKFSAGAVAISHFSVEKNGSAQITASISSNTLTITGTSTCQTATISVTAHNATDACSVVDTFTVATTCVKALHCTTNDSSNVAVGLTDSNSSFNQDGSFNYGSFLVGLQPSAFVYNFTSHSDSYVAISSGTALAPVIPANTTGSDRNVFVKISWTIPSGFTNSGTLDCTYTFTQATSTLLNFDCDTMLSNTRVLPDGTVTVPEISPSAAGTFQSVTLSPSSLTKYPENITASNVNRTVIYNIQIGTGYKAVIGGVTYTAGQNAPCSKTIVQTSMPASAVFGTTDMFLSYIGFDTPTDVCGHSNAFTFTLNNGVKTTGTQSFVQAHLGEQLSKNGRRFSGGNQWWGASFTAGSTIGGGNQGVFDMIQIDNDGLIINAVSTTCQNSPVNYGQSIYPGIL